MGQKYTKTSTYIKIKGANTSSIEIKSHPKDPECIITKTIPIFTKTKSNAWV